MALGFQKFISEVFVNGKFPKISRYTVIVLITVGHFRPCKNFSENAQSSTVHTSD